MGRTLIPCEGLEEIILNDTLLLEMSLAMFFSLWAAGAVWGTWPFLITQAIYMGHTKQLWKALAYPGGSSGGGTERLNFKNSLIDWFEVFWMEGMLRVSMWRFLHCQSILAK